MAKPSPGDTRSIDSEVEALSQSRIYLDYQRAFTEGTGLPLSLHVREMMRLVHYPRQQANPFCALMAKNTKACSACYALQLTVAQQAGLEAKTLKCFAGLCESAIPVRVGENLIAFLQTGQILLHKPTARQFNRVASALLKWGAEVDLKSLEEAFFETRVLAPARYEGFLRLLTIFAGHLAACANELLLRPKDPEPAVVAKARLFIAAHHAEELSLARVAGVVNGSATYFSKCFKQTTGMTFVDYIGRVRVEKAKNLLQNPNLRISGIALDVGFGSLSQFNRTFKRITGRSPQDFRRK